MYTLSGYVFKRPRGLARGNNIAADVIEFLIFFPGGFRFVTCLPA
jgi:hypothetical protein